MNQHRWSDEKLDEFHTEFQEFSAKFDRHIGDEAFEQSQQQELYAAVFQKADSDTNTPPGLLQMVSQISRQMHDLRGWQDRQKTFVGGVVFAVSAVWFLLSGAGRTLFQFFGKL